MIEFTAQHLSTLIFWVAVTAVVFSGLGTLLAMLVWALARELFGVSGAKPLMFTPRRATCPSTRGATPKPRRTDHARAPHPSPAVSWPARKHSVCARATALAHPWSAIAP